MRSFKPGPTTPRGAKTFSTGYTPALVRSYLALLRHFRHNRTFARDQHKIFCQVAAAFRRYGRLPIERASVLEIGCGQRFTLTLLFHALGAQAVGVDLDYVDPDRSARLPTFLASWRRNGLERAVKTFGRRLLFDRTYYHALEQAFGQALPTDRIDLRVMDARALQFPDTTFDYACSSDVFEHIDGVEQATHELARVLKPGGIAYVGINLFAGISGGHHFEWADPDRRPSRAVPAWDHLRQNRFPSQAYLNRWRERDFLAAFRRDFAILEIMPIYQGETQLTTELEHELAGYGREELLRGGITAILQKPL